jgi:MOSC domain-containing protein YiiM
VTEGALHSINTSAGGVPKLAQPDAVITLQGVRGDRQRNPGGPERAVCLYSLELIRALQAEGHPVGIGSMGENLTLSGTDWAAMVPGAVLEIGAAEIELTEYTDPCRSIAGSFSDGRFSRVAQKKHPGWSRLYARVLREGAVRVGDRVRMRPR